MQKLEIWIEVQGKIKNRKKMIPKGGQLETYSHGHCYGEVKKPAKRE